jgi:hypothetical protein
MRSSNQHHPLEQALSPTAVIWTSSVPMPLIDPPK